MQTFRPLLILMTITAVISSPFLSLMTGAQEESHLRPLSKQELNRALLAAVEEDSEDKALAALNRGADVNARDQYGRTALMQARENMTRLLLKRGANIHLQDKYGNTALFLATSNSKKMEVLLDQGADINARNGDGLSLLLTALIAKERSSVSLLKRRRARVGLVEAACEGEMNTVRQLLQPGKPSAQEKGRALVYALMLKQTDIVNFLLEQKADLNARARGGLTALMLAASEGDFVMVRTLIERGADVRAQDREGYDALMYNMDNLIYIHDNVDDIYPYLIRNGADLRAQSKRGQTALHLAAERGYAYLLPALIQAGAAPDARDKEGRTPLLAAMAHIFFGRWIEHKDIHNSIAETLIPWHTNLDIQTRDGMTALMYAAKWGSADCVKTLLKGGADVHRKDKRGRTALTWAAWSTRRGKENPMVQALLEAGAKVDFIEAMQIGEAKQAKLLLARGADIRKVGPHNETALMIAAEQGYGELVEMLLARGLNVNAQDDWGCTALMLTVSGRPVSSFLPRMAINSMWFVDERYEPSNFVERRRIVMMLLEKGAEINIHTHTDKDKGQGEGVTALMLASIVGDVEMIEILLTHGADINAQTQSGDTAWSLATRYNRQTVLPRLQKAGAKPEHSEP